MANIKLLDKFVVLDYLYISRLKCAIVKMKHIDDDIEFALMFNYFSGDTFQLYKFLAKLKALLLYRNSTATRYKYFNIRKELSLSEYYKFEIMKVRAMRKTVFPFNTNLVRMYGNKKKILTVNKKNKKAKTETT